MTNSDATFLGQLSSVLIVITYVGLATSVVWFALKETMGIRVTSETEQIGIDESDYVMNN